MRISKKVVALFVAFALSIIGAFSVFAESVGTASSAVTSAMTTVANDMLATGNAIIPIALTVVGLAMVVVFGVRIFKRIAK